MITGLQTDGFDRFGIDFGNLIDLTVDEVNNALLQGASEVMQFAKTERFRKVAGANKRIKVVTGWSARRYFGKYPGYNTKTQLVIKPIAGILTMRSGTYVRRIGPPQLASPGNVTLSARVPYASFHEDHGRPVLSAAIEAKRQRINELVALKVNTVIEREW